MEKEEKDIRFVARFYRENRLDTTQAWQKLGIGKQRNNSILTSVRYNLKQCKLPVFDEFYINGGLLFKKAICCNCRESVRNEVVERAVS